MRLIVVVKAFPFLLSISRKQRGVYIKKHEPGHLDGIDLFAHLAHDVIKLSERVVIHAVEEQGQRKARGHGAVHPRSCPHSRCRRSDRASAASSRHPYGCGVGLGHWSGSCFFKGMEEFLYHEKASIRGRFASIEI